MEALLWAIEDVFEIFGLKLNKGKCQLIAGKERIIRFKDGTRVTQTSTAIYLGSLLHQTANPRPEIIRRINGAAYVRRKLDVFWRKAAISKKQKVIMYESLISAKLLYALETLPIPQNMYDRIDAAYYKGLRQIMDWKTTYGQMQEGEEATNTNEKLIQELNKVAASRKRKTIHSTRPPFEKLSTRIKDRAIKLLAKAIRSNPENPMAEVIMAGDIWNIPEKGDNRVGRPKVNWLIETAKNALRKHKLYESFPGRIAERDIDFNYKNKAYVKHLIAEARKYTF